MVEMCAQRANKGGIEGWSTENIPKDFLLDLSRNLITNRPSSGEHNQTHAKWSAERGFFPLRNYDWFHPDRVLYEPLDPPKNQHRQPAVQKTKKRPADPCPPNRISPISKRPKTGEPAHCVIVIDSDEMDVDIDLLSKKTDSNSGNTKTKTESPLAFLDNYDVVPVSGPARTACETHTDFLHP
jgi:hypothetical protein